MSCRWFGESAAGDGVIEEGADRRGAQGALLAADAPLEQQRQWWKPDAFVMVVGGDQRYGAVGAADTTDDRAEDFGKFGTDHEEPFGVAFRWRYLQQRHDFAGGRQPVLHQAVVRQFGEFLRSGSRLRVTSR